MERNLPIINRAISRKSLASFLQSRHSNYTDVIQKKITEVISWDALTPLIYPSFLFELPEAEPSPDGRHFIRFNATIVNSKLIENTIKGLYLLAYQDCMSQITNRKLEKTKGDIYIPSILHCCQHGEQESSFSSFQFELKIKTLHDIFEQKVISHFSPKKDVLVQQIGTYPDFHLLQLKLSSFENNRVCLANQYDSIMFRCSGCARYFCHRHLNGVVLGFFKERYQSLHKFEMPFGATWTGACICKNCLKSLSQGEIKLLVDLLNSDDQVFNVFVYDKNEQLSMARGFIDHPLDEMDEGSSITELNAGNVEAQVLLHSPFLNPWSGNFDYKLASIDEDHVGYSIEDYAREILYPFLTHGSDSKVLSKANLEHIKNARRLLFPQEIALVLCVTDPFKMRTLGLEERWELGTVQLYGANLDAYLRNLAYQPANHGMFPFTPNLPLSDKSAFGNPYQDVFYRLRRFATLLQYHELLNGPLVSDFDLSIHYRLNDLFPILYERATSHAIEIVKHVNNHENKMLEIDSLSLKIGKTASKIVIKASTSLEDPKNAGARDFIWWAFSLIGDVKITPGRVVIDLVATKSPPVYPDLVPPRVELEPPGVKLLKEFGKESELNERLLLFFNNILRDTLDQDTTIFSRYLPSDQMLLTKDPLEFLPLRDPLRYVLLAEAKLPQNTLDYKRMKYNNDIREFVRILAVNWISDIQSNPEQEPDSGYRYLDFKSSLENDSIRELHENVAKSKGGAAAWFGKNYSYEHTVLLLLLGCFPPMRYETETHFFHEIIKFMLDQSPSDLKFTSEYLFIHLYYSLVLQIARTSELVDTGLFLTDSSHLNIIHFKMNEEIHHIREKLEKNKPSWFNDQLIAPEASLALMDFISLLVGSWELSDLIQRVFSRVI